MTSRHITHIAADVQLLLEREAGGQSVEGFGADARERLRQVVEHVVLGAVEQIHRAAPTQMLDGGNTFGDSLFWDEAEDGQPATGHVLLPDDYMRLVVFEMSDWERPVYVAGAEGDPRFAKHSSRMKGVRGTPQRPVCAIGMRGEGAVLEFRSCKNRHATISRAVYLPYPAIDGETQTIDICTKCYRAVVALTASRVQGIRGNAQAAQQLEQMAAQLIGVTKG